MREKETKSMSQRLSQDIKNLEIKSREELSQAVRKILKKYIDEEKDK